MLTNKKRCLSSQDTPPTDSSFSKLRVHTGFAFFHVIKLKYIIHILFVLFIDFVCLFMKKYTLLHTYINFVFHTQEVKYKIFNNKFTSWTLLFYFPRHQIQIFYQNFILLKDFIFLLYIISHKNTYIFIYIILSFIFT